MGVREMQTLSLDRHRIQWYPGHIAKAERQLKEQLSRVDVVFDVRDARIMQSTEHPLLKEWTRSKRRFVLVNRIDMVSGSDLAAWRRHFSKTGQAAQTYYTNGKSGAGVGAVIRAAEALSSDINANRVRRGLKSRPVRACVVGYPNIGKSALINRLLKRRVADSASMPGVTRALRWIRMGQGLDLLDSPGIIPGNLDDQEAAARLAACNDIGEASYDNSAVAVHLIERIATLPRASEAISKVEERYEVEYEGSTGEDVVWALADRLFQGDPEKAGHRVLRDYRELRLGRFALEHPSH